MPMAGVGECCPLEIWSWCLTQHGTAGFCEHPLPTASRGSSCGKLLEHIPVITYPATECPLCSTNPDGKVLERQRGEGMVDP